MPPETPPDTPVIPEVIEPRNSDDYLEVMTRAVFQAGVRWAQIAQYWNAYRRAFKAFEAAAVASFDEFDVERILAAPGILHVRRKIDATIANARTLLALEREFGSVDAYIASFADYPSLAKAFKKRFAFMGDMNVWYVLFRTRHTVPRFERWVASIPGDHPRMREMVERARATGRSSEEADSEAGG